MFERKPLPHLSHDDAQPNPLDPSSLPLQEQALDSPRHTILPSIPEDSHVEEADSTPEIPDQSMGTSNDECRGLDYPEHGLCTNRAVPGHILARLKAEIPFR